MNVIPENGLINSGISLNNMSAKPFFIYLLMNERFLKRAPTLKNYIAWLKPHKIKL